MADESVRGNRVLDITSGNITRAQTFGIAKCIILSLKVSQSGRLYSTLLQMTPQMSSNLTEDCALRNIPKVGPHTNSPLWVAKLCNTIIRRGDTSDSNVINTDLNTWHNGLQPRDTYLAIMAKVDTLIQSGANILKKVIF